MILQNSDLIVCDKTHNTNKTLRTVNLFEQNPITYNNDELLQLKYFSLQIDRNKNLIGEREGIANYTPSFFPKSRQLL